MYRIHRTTYKLRQLFLFHQATMDHFSDRIINSIGTFCYQRIGLKLFSRWVAVYSRGRIYQFARVGLMCRPSWPKFNWTGWGSKFVHIYMYIWFIYIHNAYVRIWNYIYTVNSTYKSITQKKINHNWCEEYELAENYGSGKKMLWGKLPGQSRRKLVWKVKSQRNEWPNR